MDAGVAVSDIVSLERNVDRSRKARASGKMCKEKFKSRKRDRDEM